MRKKGHNYQRAQRCCIVIDRRLICACCANLTLTQGGMSYNFEPKCYTKVHPCFCSLLTVRLHILNYSLIVWLILSGASYHECISRVVTVNGYGNGLCIMLPHNYGGKPVFSVLFTACSFDKSCVSIALYWQLLCTTIRGPACSRDSLKFSGL